MDRVGGINFDIAAILILGFDFFLFFSRRRLAIPQTAFFLLLLFMSLGASVTDVITVVTYERAWAYPRGLIIAVNTLYYLFQNSIAPVFCVFILALDGDFYRLRRNLRGLVLVPWLAAVAIIASTPMTGLAFSFDGVMRYSRGPALPTLYGISALYAIACLASLVRERASLSGRTILALALFLPFTLVSFAMQFFLPELLIVNFGIAVSELIILFSVNDFDAFIDGQTRLFNRAGFAAMLESVFQRRARAVALLVLVDNKEFLGHAVGPERSTDLERAMIEQFLGREAKRRFAARLDFCEYAVILPGRDSVSAGTVKDRILDGLTGPLRLGGIRFAPHAKLCELSLPDDARDALAVFQALRGLSLDPGDNPRDAWVGPRKLSLSLSKRQLEIEEALKRALDRSELKVHFQPIVHAPSGRAVAAEALVRLVDDELGPIGPGEFIPIAERDGLIHAIGDFVVERSCEFLSSLRTEGLSLGFMDVNLSPVQFAQHNLSERLLNFTGRYGLSSSDICFEVTETAAAQSPLAMRRTMEDLASRGFSVSIDDFGIGNSNLLSLIRTPFSTIKLDRSLVVAAGESESGLAELGGVIAMFKRVGVALIAEGVETIDQAKMLEAFGVELIQGYFYSRPLPPEGFKAFCRGRTAPCT